MKIQVNATILYAASVAILFAASLPARAQRAAKDVTTKAAASAPVNVANSQGQADIQGQADGQVIVVSLKDHELALLDNGVVKAVYPVAVGKPSTPSPTGTFTIINHVKDPTYYRPGVVIPPGRWNPVGNRWMGLSARGYGIHGTDVQSSVGKAVSHGCIRLRKHDIEALFAQVHVGTKVVIFGQRDAETIALFGGPAAPQSVHVPATVLAAKSGRKVSRPATATETAELTATAMPAGR
jgi:lipoprotein-anchoring transpeptidase ErfK/SrfK